MASSNPQQFTGKAIVSYDDLEKGGWKMEEVTTRALQDNELVVEMVASGICHTDILCGGENAGPLGFYPRVLGHEGSGYIRAVGKNVQVGQPGDPVLLSFDSCGLCHTCNDGHASYCYEFQGKNFAEHHATFSKADGNGPDFSGLFFGQSSFAHFSIVSERSVVNVKDVVKDKHELQLFSPLGCGIQTGSGTVHNVAKAQKKDVIAIIGQGGVGLSAIMAAKIAGCRIIIGIDRVQTRLDLAKELGATHTVDTSALPAGKTLVDVIREIGDGVGSTITIDTSGFVPLITQGLEFTRSHGKMIQVGSAPPDAVLDIPIFMNMVQGKQYMGAIEGESVASEYIPLMIQWYRDGKFPVEKLIKFLPAEDFAKGLHEMHTGQTVKPVLLWS